MHTLVAPIIVRPINEARRSDDSPTTNDGITRLSLCRPHYGVFVPSTRRAIFYPGAEFLNPFLWPRRVAWHISRFDTLENCLAIVPNVLIAPQVKRPPHLGPIHVAEQGFNVLLEAH